MTVGQAASLVSSVEQALQNLYDPDALQNSPLIRMLGLTPERGASPLRQLLVDAIELLKPQAPVAQSGKAWRAYRVLYQHYVGQLSRSEVAEDLGLSIRQVVREDDRAVQLLVDYLRNRYNLASVAAASSSPLYPALPVTWASTAPTRDQELQWLEASRPREHVSIAEQMQGVLATIAPLLTDHHVTTAITMNDGLPPVHVPGDILRQTLINILATSISAVPDGHIRIVAEAVERHVRVSVRLSASAPGVQHPAGQEILDSLDMVRSLVILMGGKLELLSEGAGEILALALVLPSVQQIPVLIIDDNADTRHLFERYLAESRYKFVGGREADEAVQLAQSLKPQVIVVDVMLPEVDGWELLQRLRVSPETHDTPIVVCSILPAEKLALTLGAAAYLRKPVTQQDFLAVLDGLVKE